MSDYVNIPGIADFLSPVLKVMHDLGGSAARTEIMDQVVSAVGLTDEQIETPRTRGSIPRKNEAVK